MEFDVIINCYGEVKNENLMKKTHITQHKKIVEIVSYYAEKFSKKIHWIQISTLGVYGFDGFGKIKQNINDKTFVNPLSVYEKTKLGSEIILKNYSNRFLKYTILRVGTVISKDSRKTLFDIIISLLNKNIIIFLNTKKTIFNVIYKDDLSNIIEKCIFNQKTFGKTYLVSLNISLKEIIFFFKKKRLFSLSIKVPLIIAKFFIIIFNLFKIKKIELHKLNFFIYKRRVSMKNILTDLNYKIKFNHKKIIKERLL